MIASAVGYWRAPEFRLFHSTHQFSSTDCAEAACSCNALRPDTQVTHMSPELLTGAPVDSSDDVYAFGILMCKFLATRHGCR